MCCLHAHRLFRQMMRYCLFSFGEGSVQAHKKVLHEHRRLTKEENRNSGLLHEQRKRTETQGCCMSCRCTRLQYFPFGIAMSESCDPSSTT